MGFGEHFREAEPWIIGLRRWFHEHPERSLQEEKTAGRIREELEGMGIPWQDLPPGHGVVGVIHGGKKGKTIALRADTDALPVTETTGLPFASRNAGVMHACGHDAHIAMLLGAARALNDRREDLSGTVLCVFQPAEEIGQGHREVLEYFDSVNTPDAVIGLHIWSLIPGGQILLMPGSVFAGVTSYTVTIHGRGGHGGRPDLAADPVKAACELVLKYAAIPSNFYDVLDPCVVNVGHMEAGTAGNVFPSQAKIHGSLRWLKPGGEGKILEIMRRMARGVGEIYGVTCEVDCIASIPPVRNDEGLIRRALGLLDRMEGLRPAGQAEPVFAGDNMSFYLEKVPGFYGILGGGKAQGPVYPHHHERFDLDEAALCKGAEFMAVFAEDFLTRGDKA